MSSREVLNNGDHTLNVRANAVAFAIDLAEFIGDGPPLGPDQLVDRLLAMAVRIQAYIERGVGVADE